MDRLAVVQVPYPGLRIPWHSEAEFRPPLRDSQVRGGSSSHRIEKLQSHLPLPPPITSVHRGIIAADIWGNANQGHGMKEVQCQLPLSTHLAGGDGGIVADRIRCQPGSWHGVEELQGDLPFHAFLAGAHHSIVADDIRRQLSFG